MKLHYIYIGLGIATLALNLTLMVHLFGIRKGQVYCQADEDNDVITFRLTREHNVEGVTTVAVPYDDTLPMEKDS